MIISSAVNVGNFLFCVGYYGPHGTYPYFSGGDGHYHQYVYIVEGYGIAEIRNEENGPVIEYNDTKQPGALVDQSHTMNTWQTLTTTDSSITLFYFNPIPATRNLTVNIVKAGTHNVVATDKRITIVCITGPVTANGKEILSLQYAKVLPGKSAELVIPENAVCALVSE
jgi:hypothetical protein